MTPMGNNKMDNRIQITNLTVGTTLPEVEKIVTQEVINRYAEVSQDFNPIHIDPEFARETPLGGTIAHGMLTLAYLAEMMTLAFGQDWLSKGKLGIRFKSPARPGDAIHTSGKIRKIENSAELMVIECDILCSNQNNETVVIGEAQVTIRK
jgi:3-hydroxybutyryl-CoA dehydratase